MGRPPLNMTATNIRFSKGTLERIDALVGPNRRAQFIREAVEARLKYAEQLQEMARERE